ncbi:MAG: methyltransferase domain-containing protein [Planctomycetaceae bacterium]|nr:methyltransferase domain-containing protein [Planctomycetaceae bacterium]
MSASSDEDLQRVDLQNGRVLGWYVLSQSEATGRFLQDVFAAADQQHQLPPAERSLAVDLAAGVVRRQRTLDHLLAAVISRPRADVERDLWRVLRIGVWQLLFSRVPAHAAVDTTVGLCRQLGRSRWTGFVNGVLRNLGRLIRTNAGDGPSMVSFPAESGRFHCSTQPLFADPEQEPARYAATAFSLPDALAARWAARMTPADLWAVCQWSLQQPGQTLRINRRLAKREDVVALFAAAGIETRTGQLEESLSLCQSQRIDRLPGYADGLWSVQDESAMHVAQLVNPQPGERILDLCAAPGGKTTHLAELSDDAARIVACDISDSRLSRVRQNAERLQLESITTRLIQRDGSDLPVDEFDAVLLDAPCSNTGVLNRRPEARWRFSEDDSQELAQLQRRLLQDALQCVRPGGRVIYSTCSIEPDENEKVVQAVLASVPGCRLVQQQLFLPGRPADGAFQAVLWRDT